MVFDGPGKRRPYGYGGWTLEKQWRVVSGGEMQQQIPRHPPEADSSE